jgi:hypothetical protein
MRMMKEPMLSCFFDALDYFLADSDCLLPNATALVQILLSGQPPPRRLRIEYELSRYGNTDRDSPRYFGELLQPYEGSPCGSENSSNSTSDGHADDTQKQLLLPDLVRRNCSARETSLEHIVLDSPPAETRHPSGIKTTGITVENSPSAIEGQSAVSAPTGGIVSADKLVSPHHFEDAMMVTSFYDQEVNFDNEIE